MREKTQDQSDRNMAKFPGSHTASPDSASTADAESATSRASQISPKNTSSPTAFTDQEGFGIILVASGEKGVVQIDSDSGPLILRILDARRYTAYSWSTRKKWAVLWVVALCQTSMNYNAAVYSNAVEPLNDRFNISSARLGMLAFLVSYAFGCELWAPWSEELGRWPIMQLSLLLVNLTQLLPIFGTCWPVILVGRILGGLCSAGGSVTLGMVADMFEPDNQQLAVLFASFWSCVGSVIGGICGGPIEQYLTYRWNFIIQLIFGVVVQAVHFFGCKETRSTCILDRIARKWRKQGRNVFGPSHGRTWRARFPPKKIFKTMWRPYHMLVTEPIVLLLSLLSGFSDALIFSFLESYAYVYGPESWNFSKTQLGLAMIPLLVGYILAYFSFYPVIRRDWKAQCRGRELPPERRLWWLQYQVALLPIGLLGSAFVMEGPPLPWIAPLLFSVLIGMANFSIYYATLDYMVAAYGERYAASATGGNGFARDFFAGMCVLFTKPMYQRLGTQGTTLLLFGISVLLVLPVYLFYRFGSWVRARSPLSKG